MYILIHALMRITHRVGDVIHDDDAVNVSVKSGDDGPESLLAGRVPLQRVKVNNVNNMIMGTKPYTIYELMSNSN